MSGFRGEPKISSLWIPLSMICEFFPKVRAATGYQLDTVQHGENADDWKPFATVGPGTREIRITDDGDAFRVMFVAKLGDKIHVLHCFQKKTQAKKDIDLAKKRYADIKTESGK